MNKISPVEKNQILQWVVSDLEGINSGIDKTDNLCSSAARNATTRIPVWLVIRQLQLGITEHEILESYTNLRLEDLHKVWNYYRTHKTEIETLISENEES